MGDNSLMNLFPVKDTCTYTFKTIKYRKHTSGKDNILSKFFYILDQLCAKGYIHICPAQEKQKSEILSSLSPIT